jgi:uncharacterized protein YjbJ (UPF0337 family)
MNEEHVKGVTDQAIGKTKEVVGHAVGDKELEVKGKADQVKGAVHKVAGDAIDAAKDSGDNLKTPASSTTKY